MDALDHHSTIPLHQQIADHLRARIANGRYTAGSSLPPERTLADEADVAKDAVRAALAVLAHEGLLTLARGRTAVVRPCPERKPYDLAAGTAVIARMPTGPERRRFSLDIGIPLFEVHRDCGVTLLPADQYLLMYW